MRSFVNLRNSPFSNTGSNWENDLFHEFFPAVFSEKRKSQSPEFLKCDIDENEKTIVMSFDLPGVNKEDLNIDLKDQILTISGERKGNSKNNGYSERYYGKFQRSFTIPNEIDAQQIEANYTDGVLQIALPKSIEKAAKKIEIGKGPLKALESNKNSDEAA